MPDILSKWYFWLKDATQRGSKPIEYPKDTPDKLRQQGFVDVREDIIRLPFNTWSSDTLSQDIGRWYNLGFCEGLEAMCLGPFTRVYHWPLSDVKRLVDDVKRVVCNKKYHIYNNMYVDQGWLTALLRSKMVLADWLDL